MMSALSCYKKREKKESYKKGREKRAEKSEKNI
jgi:hypothetical protein